MMDSMFGDEAAVNPLEGGALFWARTAGDGVYLYSLVIDDQGAFQIDRYDLSARPRIARRVAGAPHGRRRGEIRASSA